MACWLLVLWLSPALACSLSAVEPESILRVHSLERLHQRIDELLAINDRPELSDVLSERLSQVEDWPGLDRTKPVWILRFPPGDRPENETFGLPVVDPAAAVRTLTAGIVDATRNDQLWTIDRPVHPYYALHHDGVLWLGDSLPRLRSIIVDRPSLTVPDTVDVAGAWSFAAWPQPKRQATIARWLAWIEPWLQQRDGERDEVYRVRRRWGDAVRQVGLTLLTELDRITMGVAIDPEREAADVTVELRLTPRGTAGDWLGSWRAARLPGEAWQDLPESRATGYVVAPLAEGGRRELVAWQMFGEQLPVRGLVLTLANAARSAEAPRSLATAAPVAPPLAAVELPPLPDWTRDWIGGHPEAQVGTVGVGSAATETWFSMGPPDIARTRFEEAWTAWDPQPVESAGGAQMVADLRLPTRELVRHVPFIDPSWAAERIGAHEERIRMSVEARRERITIRITLPKGALRVLGGWLTDDLANDLPAEWLGG
jgi:hypothetical protein